VVHAEDSSSASADLQLTIRKSEWASAGILKVYPEEGPSFFFRPEYADETVFADILPESPGPYPHVLDEERSVALYRAARSYLAERVAMEYLARSEHCRYQLSLKLRKKGYLDDEISPALDFLVLSGSLDDSRFAEAWLRNRAIHQNEGRKKLLAALLERGVKFVIADSALDSFFGMVEERDLCLKAAQKLHRLGKSGQKLVIALLRKGFSGILIKECMKILETTQHVELNPNIRYTEET
jgi:regulatory protein